MATEKRTIEIERSELKDILERKYNVKIQNMSVSWRGIRLNVE